MEIVKNVSFIIKKLRLNKVWTQQDLANRLFVTRQCISKWENGQVIPNLENIEKLAEVFEIEIELFFKNGNNEELIDNRISLDKNNHQTVLKKERKSLRNYLLVSSLNILFAFITMSLLFVGASILLSLLVDILFLMVSIVILIKSNVTDLKTDKTIIYYKVSLLSFIINFALVLGMLAISYAPYPLQIAHLPALLITILLINFIGIKDKVGIIFSVMLFLLIYDFGLSGSNLYFFLGLLVILSITLSIILLKENYKNKKDLLLSIILLLFSFSIIILKIYEHSIIRNILIVVYTFLGFLSLVCFLFGKNQKYTIFGFLLYLVFIINRYIGYVLLLAFDMATTTIYSVAIPSMFLGTLGFYILIVYLFAKLYKKYEKIIFLIGVFLDLFLYEITTLLAIKSEKVYLLITPETNVFKIISYVSLVLYCLVGVIFLISKIIEMKEFKKGGNNGRKSSDKSFK